MTPRMTAVPPGTPPPQSHEEAPKRDVSKTEVTKTDVSKTLNAPPGPGLAGVAGGSSRVTADCPPAKPQVDPPHVGPAVTVKASDLPARRGDEPFDVNQSLAPEHPKLGPMSQVNQISFLPKTHWYVTYEAALAAGLALDQARKLADLVVAVDDLPHSQDPDHSYMHGMRAPGETIEHYQATAAAYRASLWAKKTMDGVAGLLHLMQDRRSPAHVGPQGPIEWHGTSNESLSALMWHAWNDRPPSAAIRQDMVEKGAALIKAYMETCGGTINN